MRNGRHAMNTTDSITTSWARSRPAGVGNDGAAVALSKPLVSVVVPAFNEAAIVEKNLAALCQYMASLEDEYRWEIVVVNDGSSDGTGRLVEAFAGTRSNITVLHHHVNFGLGQALKFAFKHCRGEYIVTMDLDLSYSTDHIRRLLTRIRETRAKVVVASPYMKGGDISNVPWHTMSTLFSGFLFKPFMFFIIPGLGLLLFSLYVNAWMLAHFFAAYQRFPEYAWFFDRASAAVATAYHQAPHTFFVGLMSLTLAIQFISLGILALQSKRYFEEIFHLGTTIYKTNRDDGRTRP